MGPRGSPASEGPDRDAEAASAYDPTTHTVSGKPHTPRHIRERDLTRGTAALERSGLPSIVGAISAADVAPASDIQWQIARESEMIMLISKEYELLREESLQSITHRTQILSYGIGGTTALGTAASIILSTGTRAFAAAALFAGAIPVVVYLTLAIWFGELERMVRAGNYLAAIEGDVNERFDQRVLYWETWLRESKMQLQFPYRRVADLLALLAIVFPFVGWAASDLAAIHLTWMLGVPLVLSLVGRVIVERGLRRLGRGSAKIASSAEEPVPSG